MGNPGSVLPGLTPFPVDPVDPVDPLENSWKAKKLVQYNDFGTFCQKIETHFDPNP